VTTSDYEKFVESVDMYTRDMGDAPYALGLAGESGEAADMVKKSLREKGFAKPITGDRERDFILELGDVLWYVTRLAQRHGHTLSQVMDLNVNKLVTRYERTPEGRALLASKMISEVTGA
jgi:NTP pyrophosphatase (non-canonical NTP hydrolase)